MVSVLRWAAPLLFLIATFAPAQDAKYSLKAAKNPPPKELDESIRKLLAGDSLVFRDPQGKPVAEFWFRGEIPADATKEQIKNGVTYREVKQTELIAAVKFEQNYHDYRKQTIKAGVYTLRLGLQPMDGDHAGKSPYLEFLVVTSAAKDVKAGTYEVEKLLDLSKKSINTGHPAVLMLFPTKPESTPKYVAKANNHWIVTTQREVAVRGQKTGAFLGIGLTVIGHADE